MARTLRQTLEDADLIVLVTEANRPVDADAELVREVAAGGRPAILVINKIDRLKSRDELLPRLAALGAYPFAEFVPISARSGKDLVPLERAILRHLPPGPPLFPPDFRTDQSESFRTAEIIREKLMNSLHQEVPYGIAVQIESMETEPDGRRRISAVIWIERESQKAIVIGKGGSVLKRVGREARLELNRLFGTRVHLALWVKLREHWSDNAEELARFGYDSA
jgi:GTP-binding protein Era